MQKSLITILVAVLMAPTLSFAEKGDIVVRARVTHIAPDESSHLDSSVGDKLEVDSNTIPEIDFSYYFTKNIAAEFKADSKFSTYGEPSVHFFSSDNVVESKTISWPLLPFLFHLGTFLLMPKSSDSNETLLDI